MQKRCIATILAGMFGAMAAPETSAQTYEINWSTVDGGGAMLTSGGAYVLSGTSGQADASLTPAAGGTYGLTGGFWVVSLNMCLAHALVDFDQDCDVDGDDLESFEACVSGPSIPRENTQNCKRADLDQDNDVDQADFGLFQRCYSGRNHVADPSCAD